MPNGQWHEVERLLESKYMNNKRHYLVKWADGSKPTLEPSKNVSQVLQQLNHSSIISRKRRRIKLNIDHNEKELDIKKTHKYKCNSMYK